MSYRVGQVVYLLSKKEIKVYPAQIVEQIKRRTIKEEITSYIVKLPDKNGTEVLIEEISADVFTSLQDLEYKMLENASVKIKSFLDDARKMATVFTPVEVIDQVPDIASPALPYRENRKKTDTPALEDQVEVDLGNGIKAKMDISQIENFGA